MKVRDKRKLITDEIKSGRITEYGFVSSRSKVIRNLNSEQCDRILASKQIKYSDHEDIVAKEGIIFSENVEGSEGSTGSDGDSEKSSMENNDENTDEDGRENDSPVDLEKVMKALEEGIEAQDEDHKSENPLPENENPEFSFVTTDNTNPMKSVADVKKTIGVSTLEKSIENSRDFTKKVVSDTIGGVVALLDKERASRLKLEKELKEVKENGGNTTLEIKVSEQFKPKKIEGVIHHPKFARIVEALQLNPDKCVYLKGGAGSGKTTLASQVAEALSLPFGALSMSEGMSEGQLLGRPTIKGGYISTDFIDKYENGGVFLFDEMDAMDANVAVVLNSALANGDCPVPFRSEKPRAIRHENFYVIGAGNTWGTGQGSNIYQGRNKLDGATLDRFEKVEIGYNPKLEKVLAGDANWYEACLELRKRAEEYSLEHPIGTRTFKKAGRYHANGKSLKYFLESQVVHWTKEEKSKVGIRDIVLQFSEGGLK